MKSLREGYTTGSCASAAAKVAVRMLAGLNIPEVIDIPFPPESENYGRQRINIPIETAKIQNLKARVTVIKDGGDDPDATNGTPIVAVADLIPGENTLSIELDGGKGVGRITLPGLPVEIGQAAINPAPRAQIFAAVTEELHEISKDHPLALPATGTLRIIIEVPEGEKIAAKTMNPQLGIVGGISILGTQGIVRPFSHASWEASISLGLDVAAACGHKTAVFTTGRRTERLFSEKFPAIPKRCIIQAADFFEHSVIAAAGKGFNQIYWSIFFGKLVKHAQGFPYTHAKDWKIDFNLLAKWNEESDIPQDICAQIPAANTARQVLQMIKNLNGADKLYKMLIIKAVDSAGIFCRKQKLPVPEIKYYLFDFDGVLLLDSESF